MYRVDMVTAWLGLELVRLRFAGNDFVAWRWSVPFSICIILNSELKSVDLHWVGEGRSRLYHWMHR